MMLKHPLQNKWAMWFFKNDKNKDWASNLRYITSFDTVEDFWALYNHILPASKLGVGCDYSLFKDGVQPMWEDPLNKKGGRWLMNLNKQQRHSDLDNYWLETLLCLIGEAFDEQSDDICGAVVNIRGKGDKLAVWTGDARNAEHNMKIGRTLKHDSKFPRVFPSDSKHTRTPSLNLDPRPKIDIPSSMDTSSVLSLPPPILRPLLTPVGGKLSQPFLRSQIV